MAEKGGWGEVCMCLYVMGGRAECMCNVHVLFVQKCRLCVCEVCGICCMLWCMDYCIVCMYCKWNVYIVYV